MEKTEQMTITVSKVIEEDTMFFSCVRKVKLVGSFTINVPAGDISFPFGEGELIRLKPSCLPVIVRRPIFDVASKTWHIDLPTGYSIHHFSECVKQTMKDYGFDRIDEVQ